MPTEIIDEEGENLSFSYQSFNLTLSEEFNKVAMSTNHLTQSQQLPKTFSKEVIPCDFLRYVANMKDDLDQFAYQLEANHDQNFPEE